MQATAAVVIVIHLVLFSKYVPIDLAHLLHKINLWLINSTFFSFMIDNNNLFFGNFQLLHVQNSIVNCSAKNIVKDTLEIDKSKV